MSIDVDSDPSPPPSSKQAILDTDFKDVESESDDFQDIGVSDENDTGTTPGEPTDHSDANGESPISSALSTDTALEGEGSGDEGDSRPANEIGSSSPQNGRVAGPEVADPPPAAFEDRPQSRVHPQDAAAEEEAEAVPITPGSGSSFGTTTRMGALVAILISVMVAIKENESSDCHSWLNDITLSNHAGYEDRVRKVEIHADAEGKKLCTLQIDSNKQCTIDVNSPISITLARLSGYPFNKCALLIGDSKAMITRENNVLQARCITESMVLRRKNECTANLSVPIPDDPFKGGLYCINEDVFCESMYGPSSCTQEFFDVETAMNEGIKVESVKLKDKSHKNIRVFKKGRNNVTLQAPFQFEAAGKVLKEFDAEMIAVLKHEKTGQIYQCDPVSVQWTPRFTYGMDLGTTYSCIAVLDSKTGQVKVMELDKRLGKKEVPTAVYFPPKDSGKPILFGYDAIEMNGSDPENLIIDMKRFVGRHFGDPEVQNYKDRYAFRIDAIPSTTTTSTSTSASASSQGISVWVPNINRSFLPEEILALFIRWAVSQVDDHFALGHSKTVPPKLLVSIPAYFHNGQRKGIRDAVKIAAQQLVQTVVEPTAAGVRAKQENKMGDYRRVQVWDMGGGTFDVSVIECNNKALCKVLSTSGNTVLGGRDFDELVVQMAINEFNRKFGWKKEDWTEEDLQSLRGNAEEYKKSISVNGQTTIRHKQVKSRITQQIALNLDQLEKAAQPLLESAWNAALDSLNILPSVPASSMGQNDNNNNNNNNNNQNLVRTVILVGGTTKFKFFKDFVQRKYDENRARDSDGNIMNRVSVISVDNPQLAVVQGTSYVANSLVQVSDVLPLSIGIQICQSVSSRDMIKGREYEQKNGRWYDCDIMDIILSRNTPYHEGAKSSMTKYYCQYQPGDDYVDLILFEGESKHASENFKLGKVRITGVDPRNPNKPCDNVAVQAEMDSNGVVHLLAKYNDNYSSSTTGQLKVITDDGTLNEDQIKNKAEEIRTLYLKNRF